MQLNWFTTRLRISIKCYILGEFLDHLVIRGYKFDFTTILEFADCAILGYDWIWLQLWSEVWFSSRLSYIFLTNIMNTQRMDGYFLLTHYHYQNCWTNFGKETHYSVKYIGYFLLRFNIPVFTLKKSTHQLLILHEWSQNNDSQNK